MARRRSTKHRIPQLSDEEYFKQLATQDGGCWICRRPPKNRRHAGDHSHLNGQRRGLLCYVCNRFMVGAIERFRIDPERLAEYFRVFGH